MDAYPELADSGRPYPELDDAGAATIDAQEGPDAGTTSGGAPPVAQWSSLPAGPVTAAAFAGSSLYVIENGAVYRTSLAPPFEAPSFVWSSSLSPATTLAAWSTTLYVASNFQIVAIDDTDGGATVAVELASRVGESSAQPFATTPDRMPVQGIAAGDGYVAFFNQHALGLFPEPQ
jgi:hypothetical protein